ncbi:germacrene A synthase-like [Amaranthus tricolor]|uniref:germacrene A synthase-like n=1 Tax=Amaranthus tricolor TaxID=29722 RepID=UPI002588B0B6|nr:germacrene A synthase-like [Amaranthus tricolor]
MAPYEALYGRKCRSPICWNYLNESLGLGPDMIEETTKKVRMIQERMRGAQDHQKSYADKRRRALEFEVGSYEVLERIGEVAYRLVLPMNLAKVHNVFHVSQLRKYVHDPSHITQHETIELDETLTFEEKPIKILDTKTRCTRNKEIMLVKILWMNQEIEEATWKTEVDIIKRYPELFEQVIDCVGVMEWTRSLEYERKFPFARERAAENYYWALGACYEPKYSYARILLAKFSILITVVDNIFDSYGTIDGLDLFTDAIHRWNSSCMNLDIFQELEQELAHEGRTYAVSYLNKKEAWDKLQVKNPLNGFLINQRPRKHQVFSAGS